jgi:hypothetical protein
MLALLHRTARLLLFFFPASLTVSAYSQSVSVSGPDCVISGPIYLYTISGQWQSGSTVRVCVTGGILADSGGTCIGGAGILSFVRVSWDSGGQTSGTIAVSSSLGDTTLVIQITTPLSGGQVDSSEASQSIDTLTVPSTIGVPLATGGGCQPTYVYQWQQSTDMVSWLDIAGANAQNLSFTSALAQTTFFRRKVIETVSGTIGYSNEAVVIVNYLNH